MVKHCDRVVVRLLMVHTMLGVMQLSYAASVYTAGSIEGDLKNWPRTDVLQRCYERLPKELMRADTIWIGENFPVSQGRFANRGAGKIASGKKVSKKEKNLSPVEKYDLINGRNDMPRTKEELRFVTARSNIPRWEGVCHLLRLHQLWGAKPQPRTENNIELTERDALAIALMKLHQDDFKIKIAGGRRGCCDDTRINAATFHIVLSNYLTDTTQKLIQFSNGIHLGAYGIFNEIPLEYRVAAETWINTETVIIKNEICYRTEDWRGKDIDSWREYTYELRLDSSGTIIDGKWLSDEDTVLLPDFLYLSSPK